MNSNRMVQVPNADSNDHHLKSPPTFGGLKRTWLATIGQLVGASAPQVPTGVSGTAGGSIWIARTRRTTRVLHKFDAEKAKQQNVIH